MIVVDASAVLEVLLGTPKAEAVARRIFDSGETLHAPHLIDLEVAQVLRRYVAAHGLDPGRAQEAIEDHLDLPLFRYPHDVLLPRIWELRHDVTAYDAAYLALAEGLDAPLLTGDGRLADAPGHTVRVDLI